MKPSLTLSLLLIAGCGAAPVDTCNQDYRKLTDDYVGLQRQCGALGPPVLREITNDAIAAVLDDLGLQHDKFQENGFVVHVQNVKHVLLNHGKNLQFWVGFTAQPAPAVINEWNRRRRFSRAYLDGEGNAVLESDLDLDGGVGIDAVREFIKTFLVSVDNYAGFIGRSLPPPPEST